MREPALPHRLPERMMTRPRHRQTLGFPWPFPARIARSAGIRSPRSRTYPSSAIVFSRALARLADQLIDRRHTVSSYRPLVFANAAGFLSPDRVNSVFLCRSGENDPGSDTLHAMFAAAPAFFGLICARQEVHNTTTSGRLRNVRYQVIFAHPQGLTTIYRYKTMIDRKFLATIRGLTSLPAPASELQGSLPAPKVGAI